MSKKGIARKGADKKTVALVEDVLAMAAKNRYSVSKIFAAHNAVFELKEQAQSCASCLTTRVSALRKWYGEAAPVDNPEAYRNAVLGQTSPAQATTVVRDVLTPQQVQEQYEAALRENLSEDSGPDGLLAAMELLAGDTSSDLHEYAGKMLEQHKAELEARIAADNSGPDYLDPTRPNHVAPAEGVTRYPMGEGLIPFDFTPSKDDALKGTIKGADGSNVKAGTYTTADGTTIAVSVGNKATIKDDLI